jgi:hypothetical protein
MVDHRFAFIGIELFYCTVWYVIEDREMGEGGLSGVGLGWVGKGRGGEVGR